MNRASRKRTKCQELVLTGRLYNINRVTSVFLAWGVFLKLCSGQETHLRKQKLEWAQTVPGASQSVVITLDRAVGWPHALDGTFCVQSR